MNTEEEKGELNDFNDEIIKLLRKINSIRESPGYKNPEDVRVAKQKMQFLAFDIMAIVGFPPAKLINKWIYIIEELRTY